jgi:hypothetical protein
MVDREWERWRAIFEQMTRPLPSVVRRARTDRVRAWVGMTGIYVLALTVGVVTIPDLRGAHTVVVLSSPLLTFALLAIILVGTHASMRGSLGRTGSGSLLQLLADMERRHAGRRRLIRLLPWFTGLAVSGAIADSAIAMASAGRFSLGAALGTLGTCGFTVVFVWFVAARTARTIDCDLREAAEVRRLMTDGEEVDPQASG